MYFRTRDEQAFTKSMPPKNISSGFRCTGTYPLNPLLFPDHEVVAANVTDQLFFFAETKVLENSYPPATPTHQSVTAQVRASPITQPSTCDQSHVSSGLLDNNYNTETKLL